MLFFLRRLNICLVSCCVAALSLCLSPVVVLATTDVPTSVSIIIVCGDGFKSIDEVCDKGDIMTGTAADFGGHVCSEYEYSPGNHYNSGYLICNSDCQSILTNMCSFCPNGMKEGIEECDGADFGGYTCRTYGFTSGTLACTTACRLNLNGCISEGVSLGGSSGGAPARGGGGSASDTGFPNGSDKPQQETKIVIQGKAYPNVDVHILMDGKIVGIVKADAKANFSFETKDVTPGIASFSFWAEDKNAVKSTVITLTFRIISGAVTTISGAYLSPTISADKTTVSLGDIVKYNGQTVPDTKVFVHVVGKEEVVSQVNSDLTSGEWNLDFNTKQLKEGEQYLAKSLFQINDGDNVVRSGFGRSLVLNVGTGEKSKKCEGADLNGDKRVNLTDFSILLFRWGTNDACADQNANGKVDLADFSIMMYYWTG